MPGVGHLTSGVQISMRPQFLSCFCPLWPRLLVMSAVKCSCTELYPTQTGLFFKEETSLPAWRSGSGARGQTAALLNLCLSVLLIQSFCYNLGAPGILGSPGRSLEGEPILVSLPVRSVWFGLLDSWAVCLLLI